MASFFGIQEWYEKSVFELSGGQKQLLALAAVLSMQPDVLILDEPTAQLDPIAAEDFIETLKKINDEIGNTIILSEHRLEGVLPRADHAVVMADGKIVCQGNSSEVARELKEKGDPMLSAMPTPMRVFLALEDSCAVSASCNDGIGRVPQTVREGRLYLEREYGDALDRRGTDVPRDDDESVIADVSSVTAGEYPSSLRGASRSEQREAEGDEAATKQSSNDPLLKLKEVWFRYERDGQDIVKDLALTVYPGEFVCVVGGNGTGKSTMLGVISGENKYYRGYARTLGLDPKKERGETLTNAGLAILPQDPQTLFTRATVFDNLVDVAFAYAKRRGENPSPEDIEAEVLRVCEMTDTLDLMGFHPYDVSGGEQQRTGLSMALLTRPKLLLLDEPTKGMDGFFKEKFSAILKNLCDQGIGVLMVSHDVEFCAKYADRCALFFNGSIVSEGEPRTFFSGNSFYTTAANRMARELFPNAITAEEIIAMCK